MSCILCSGETKALQDKQFPITYHVCQECDLIFKDESNRISSEKEMNEYSRHNNSMESTGYVNIFRSLIEQYISPLAITGKTLDFGSGPGPVLYQLLLQAGYSAFHYDPFYNKDESYKDSLYQLITSTEVAEHFFDPLKEFQHLSSKLESGGYLLIMTNLLNMSLDEFLDWWYRRDPTHVCFYHLNTMKYIASVCGLELIKHNNKNIILFKKK